MFTVRFVDDTALNGVPSVKMTCACGWVEKAHATRDARDRGERHIKDKHTTGLMRYMDHAYEVK